MFFSIKFYLSVAERCGYPPEPDIFGELVNVTELQAIYQCLLPEFDLIGATTLTCSSNGQWEPNDAPKCKPKCNEYLNHCIL